MAGHNFKAESLLPLLSCVGDIYPFTYLNSNLSSLSSIISFSKIVQHIVTFLLNVKFTILTIFFCFLKQVS